MFSGFQDSLINVNILGQCCEYKIFGTVLVNIKVLGQFVTFCCLSKLWAIRQFLNVILVSTRAFSN